jgi:hypothetical protein
MNLAQITKADAHAARQAQLTAKAEAASTQQAQLSAAAKGQQTAAWGNMRPSQWGIFNRATAKAPVATATAKPLFGWKSKTLAGAGLVGAGGVGGAFLATPKRSVYTGGAYKYADSALGGGSAKLAYEQVVQAAEYEKIAGVLQEGEAAASQVLRGL